MKNPTRTRIASVVTLLLCVAAVAEAAPIQLHPDNPHYFLFNEQPAVLITSGEHYGAVMNLDFDYVAYLNALQAKGMNLTRIFTGSFVADSSPTLAPASGRLIAPWARSTQCCYTNGGNKFDLNVWNEAYFTRLKDLVEQARQRGIIVEIVMFSQHYNDTTWALSPLNAANNVNGVSNGAWELFTTKSDSALLSQQKALIREIAVRLNSYENVYYEICNEPTDSTSQSNVDWHNDLIDELISAEASLPNKHMIAVDYDKEFAINRMHQGISVHNSHYTWGSEWIGATELLDTHFDQNRALAFDESGILGLGSTPDQGRLEAWEFLVGGGATYNGLSFEYRPEAPAGTSLQTQFLGQLAVLKDFMESFNFVNMTPQRSLVSGGIPSGARYRVLAEAGEQYALYIHHGENGPYPDTRYVITAGSYQANPVLSLPAGSYRFDWVEPATGRVLAGSDFSHGGGNKTFASPAYSMDIALRIKATTSTPPPPSVAGDLNRDGTANALNLQLP
jgi:hypothetical protein